MTTLSAFMATIGVIVIIITIIEEITGGTSLDTIQGFVIGYGMLILAKLETMENED